MYQVSSAEYSYTGKQVIYYTSKKLDHEFHRTNYTCISIQVPKMNVENG